MNKIQHKVEQSEIFFTSTKKDWNKPLLRRLDISETNGIGGDTTADGPAPFGGAIKPSGT